MLSPAAYGESLGWSRGVYPERSGACVVAGKSLGMRSLCASSLPSACVSAATSPPHCTQCEAFHNYLLNVRTDAGSSQCEVHSVLFKCDYYKRKNIHVRAEIAYKHRHTLTLPFHLCDSPFSCPSATQWAGKTVGIWCLAFILVVSNQYLLTDYTGLDLEDLYHVVTEDFYEGELANLSACHWPNDISWKPWEIGNGGVWWAAETFMS